MTEVPEHLSLVAVVPATGLSRRMGTPKLLLTIAGQTVIEHVMRRLDHPAIRATAISCRADDTPLRELLSTLNITPVIPPNPPPDMRSSVAAILQHWGPQHSGGWLLLPADSPTVEREVLDRLIAAWQSSPNQIVVPVHQGKRGHPTLFPGWMPQELSTVPSEQGLNWLVRQQASRVLEVDCPEPSVLWDLDTPEDWSRLQSLWKTFPTHGLP